MTACRGIQQRGACEGHLLLCSGNIQHHASHRAELPTLKVAIQPNLRHLTQAMQGYTSGAALFPVMLLYGEVGSGKFRVVELWECYQI